VLLIPSRDVRVPRLKTVDLESENSNCEKSGIGAGNTTNNIANLNIRY
jgi:hypothetical protein